MSKNGNDATSSFLLVYECSVEGHKTLNTMYTVSCCLRLEFSKVTEEVTNYFTKVTVTVTSSEKRNCD